MARRRAGRLVLTTGMAFSLMVSLAACDKDGKFNLLQPKKQAEAGTDSSAAPETSVKLVERDVEAPDAFQVTEKGLWDGRPSLGGVWVAHPSVKDP